MRSYPWRAAIGRLAFLVSSIAVGACADQSITAPAARPDVVSVAAGDVVPTADADSTRVAFTIAREENYYFESTGYVQVHGTFTCSRALGEAFDLFVKVEQKRPARGSVQASLRMPVTCSTTAPQPWVAAILHPGGNVMSASRTLVSVTNAFQTLPMVPNTVSAYVKLLLSEAS